MRSIKFLTFAVCLVSLFPVTTVFGQAKLGEDNNIQLSRRGWLNMYWISMPVCNKF